MRLLLIEADAALCAHVRQRLTSLWPSSQVVVRNPVAEGTLAPEFLAQAFDAVLVGNGRPEALEWARDFVGRGGFAPVVFVSGRAGDEHACAARSFGAHAVLGREQIDGDALVHAIVTAEHRQSYARAVWREAGRPQQRFGGAFIRGYRNIRRLAAGPVSDLYLAESEHAGALVALKVARDRQEEDIELDDSFRRFLQEYEIVKRIRHPNIVRLYDLGVSDEHAWLVMEYFRAGDLRRRMRAGMDPVAGMRTLVAVARALEAIHASGILHRDLKPGNIMFRDDGSPALIDFGMSKDEALELDVTDTGLIFGTPHYLSPEQGHGEPIDVRSDLYSLGIILFEMLTGRKPYMAENPMAIIYMHRKSPLPALPEAHAELQPLVHRLLAKSPADRFDSAQDAAAAIGEALAQLRARELAA
jgi:serine/threonine protein kinase